MSTDVSHVGVALFLSFKHFSLFHLSSFSFYIPGWILWNTNKSLLTVQWVQCKFLSLTISFLKLFMGLRQILVISGHGLPMYSVAFVSITTDHTQMATPSISIIVHDHH